MVVYAAEGCLSENLCVCGCLCPGNFCGITALCQIIFLFFLSFLFLLPLSFLSLLGCLSEYVYVLSSAMCMSMFCSWFCPFLSCITVSFPVSDFVIVSVLFFVSYFSCLPMYVCPCVCGALLLWPRRVPLLCVTDCCCCLHQDDILDLQLQRNLDYLDQQVRLTQHSQCRMTHAALL